VFLRHEQLRARHKPQPSKSARHTVPALSQTYRDRHFTNNSFTALIALRSTTLAVYSFQQYCTLLQMQTVYPKMCPIIETSVCVLWKRSSSQVTLVQRRGEASM